jgi:hypothetical protein
MSLARALLGARDAQPVPEVEGPTFVGNPHRVYLAEHYLADVSPERVEDLTRRLEAAAAYQRRARTYVRFLGSAGVPGDESFLSLFAAPSLEAVARTIERARVKADRIVPVFWRAGSWRPLVP